MNELKACQLAHLQGVSKEYDTGQAKVRALNGIDITVNSNDFLAIIGPSGSGKSTLLHVLGCLTTPTKGSYLLNGEDISSFSEWKLAHIRNRMFGFVFQSFNLLPALSVLDNVCVPLIYRGANRPERIEKAKSVINQVGLSHRLKHKPNQLSGGEQQRVAIARALVGSPAVILADEPTGNLDTSSGNDILDILTGLHEDSKTVIIVTHDMHVAEKTRRMIHLVDGEIETKEEL